MSGDARQLLYILNKIAEQQAQMVRMLERLVKLAEAEIRKDEAQSPAPWGEPQAPYSTRKVG